MANFISNFFEIIRSGGVLMFPLLGLSLYLYYSAFGICFKISALNKLCSNDEKFSISYARFVESSGLQKNDVKSIFTALRSEILGSVQRRLFMLKLLSGIPPLIGLLGTVSGMMLSISSAAGDSAKVADGISEALITTQAGLVVAIPSWIMAMFATFLVQKLLITLAKRESSIIMEEAL